MKKLILAVIISLLSCSVLFSQNVSGTITLVAAVTDNAPAGGTACGIASVQFFANTNPLGPALTSPNSGSNYTMPFNTSTMANGSYTLTAKATDKAGSSSDPAKVCDGSKPNVGVSNVLNVTVNNVALDTTAPTINITIIVTVAP